MTMSIIKSKNCRVNLTVLSGVETERNVNVKGIKKLIYIA
jgi:hypothetical protein